jgi:hypothetical protein
MNAARRHGHDLSPLRSYEGEAAKRIRWLLDHTHDRSDSMGESLLDYRLLMAGLPLPLRQPTVYDETGTFVARPDCLWEIGAIHEFDGTAKWLNDDGTADIQRIRQAQRRTADLEALGWLVTTSQWRDVTGKSNVTARIQQSIDQASKLPAPRGTVQLLALPAVEFPDWNDVFEVPAIFNRRGT